MPNSHSLAAKYPKVPETIDARGDGYVLPIFPAADPSSKADWKVLFLSADGPELPELDVPMSYLRERGAMVKLACPDWIFKTRNPPGSVLLAEWLVDEVYIVADLSMKDVVVSDFDAVFIPGGAWNPDSLRTDPDALRIVREAQSEGLLIVSLCHGPQVLISANASAEKPVFPQGTQITGVKSIRVDLRNAGFQVFEDRPTVYDKASRLLTARDPDDLGPLCEMMGKLLL